VSSLIALVFRENYFYLPSVNEEDFVASHRVCSNHRARKSVNGRCYI
jgi:hypothetical protein